MGKAPQTLEGWFVLHDFRKFDWARWKSVSYRERDASIHEFETYLQAAERVEDAPEGSSALYSIVGHKADLLLLHLRPTVKDLGALERAFNLTHLADFTTQTYSYLSVIELSLYEASARGGGTMDPVALAQDPANVRRLKLQIPDKPYICFYPMSKRRGETVNWYTAPVEDRRVMMREHGQTGRRYSEDVIQMVTGSTGLDDWEWGVTLFASDALPIKKLVYEMRWDEVSAKYGQFGPFLVGTRVHIPDVRSLLQVG